MRSSRPDNPTITVCALVPYQPGTTPSQRYRIEQWMPLWRERGISVELLPFADEKLMRLLHHPGCRAAKASALAAALMHRLRDMAAVRRYDVVVIHRAAAIVGPALLERAIAQLRRPVIFDFDDAIYLLHTTHANRHWGWLKFPGKTAAICRLSRHVVVGNSFLAEYARCYNSRVTVVPSSVDTEHYRPQEQSKPGKRLVLGWTGSSTSQTYLELFAPVLREIMAACDVELRVHSDREPELPGVPYVWRPWRPDTEIDELSQFDIGIMPMPDNRWAQGKCAMKALLYMAMGTPAVCSAIGTNCEVIQHGQNGLLATTPEDWVQQVQILVADAKRRAELGAAGRRTVEQQYSREVCASHFERVIRETAEGS